MYRTNLEDLNFWVAGTGTQEHRAETAAARARTEHPDRDGGRVTLPTVHGVCGLYSELIGRGTAVTCHALCSVDFTGTGVNAEQIWRVNGHMMTSSNGNIFHVTGPLCGEFMVTGEFLSQRPVTRSFNGFFDLYLRKTVK